MERRNESLEEIRKIRDSMTERHSKMSKEEQLMDIRSETEKALKQLAVRKSRKNHSVN